MPLTAPTLFVLTNQGLDHNANSGNTGAIRVSFTNNAGAGYFHRVQAMKVGASSWKNWLVLPDLIATGVIIFDERAVSYHVRIRAEDSTGAVTAWVTLATDPVVIPDLPANAAAILPPTGFTLASSTYSGVLLTWTDNSNNESAFQVQVDPPGGSPTSGNAKFFTVKCYDGGSILIPLGPAGLAFATTYTCRLYAIGGRQHSLADTFVTPYTADLNFTTVAAHIAFTNIPVQPGHDPVAVRGIAFNFQLLTNSPATAFTIMTGALPTGLSLGSATGLITGTTTVAAANFALTIKCADASTNDTQALTIRVQTPAFNFLNLPTTVQLWHGVAFTMNLLTNTAFSAQAVVNGSLPTGLVLTSGTGVLSGTTSVADGQYTVIVQATDSVLGLTVQAQLVMNLSTPALVTRVAPTAGGLAPRLGPDWGAVKGILGTPFDWTASSTAFGPITAGTTLTLQGAPVWLAVSGATLRFVGTPTAAGTFNVGITVSNGTQTNQTVLQIVVQPVTITNALALTVYAETAINFPLTATPAGCAFTADDMPTGLLFTVVGAAYSLTGSIKTPGVYTFPISATLGGDTDSETMVITVASLIGLNDGTTEVDGDLGVIILDGLTYHGTCQVEHWYISGGPPGVEIAALDCPGAYAGTQNFVAITGTPTAAGFFQSIITAQVCCAGYPELHSVSILFVINGGYFLGWLHTDRTLFDLQFQVRGDAVARAVHSWYEIAATAAATTTASIKDTSTTGVEVDKTTSGTVAATAGNLLTMKRGDHMKIAILVRDGKTVLGTADGVAAVVLAFRLPDDPDGELLLSLPAVSTTVTGHEYFLAEFDVTSGMMEYLMTDANVTGADADAAPIQVLGEIHCTLNGSKVSSGTFSATLVEDVA